VHVQIIAVLGMVVAAAAHGQATSSCLSQSADGLALRGYVRELVSTADTQRVRLRNHLGLSKMDSTKVVLVGTAAICNSVAVGINAALQTPGLVRQLYVVQAGRVFAAQDPGHPAGEHWPTVVVDSKYKFVSAVMAP
jgi:hypothetical protein